MWTIYNGWWFSFRVLFLSSGGGILSTSNFWIALANYPAPAIESAIAIFGNLNLHYIFSNKLNTVFSFPFFFFSHPAKSYRWRWPDSAAGRCNMPLFVHGCVRKFIWCGKWKRQLPLKDKIPFLNTVPNKFSLIFYCFFSCFIAFLQTDKKKEIKL